MSKLQDIAASTEMGGQLGIYLPPGWGQFWRARRNNSGSALARVALSGDSIGRGAYSSNLNTKGWAALLGSTLRTNYGDGGSGWQGVCDTNQWMTQLGFGATPRTNYASQQVGQTGTWGLNGDPSGPGGCNSYSNTAGSTLTFTVRGSNVTLWYLQKSNSTSTLTWSIDGVTQPTVNSNNATTAVVGVTASGLSSGTHTVVVTHPTDANYSQIYGVEGVNSTGVVFHNYSVFGGGYASQNNHAYDFQAGVSHPADLFVFELGANDSGQGTAADTWAQNVAIYLNSARNGLQGSCDILFVLPHIGKKDNSVPHWGDYMLRARGLADAYGAGIVNFSTLGRNSWDYWNSLGYFSDGLGTGNAGTDVAHPSDAGHLFMANTITSILTA